MVNQRAEAAAAAAAAAAVAGPGIAQQPKTSDFATVMKII